MGVPTQWDERTDRFTLMGNFCTPACCCAYVQTAKPFMRRNHPIAALQRLLGKMGMKFTEIPDAPPRYMLEKYGGPMTIEEYRAPGLFTHREMRRDEYVMDWVPQEVGVIVWGRLVTCKGVTPEEVCTAVSRTAPATKRLRTGENTGLQAFLQCNRTKL